MRFSSRANVLPGSRIRHVLAQVAELRKRGTNIYEFHIGQPGLPPSKEMLEDFCKLLLEKSFEVSSYTPVPGIEELRMAISEDYTYYSGVKINVENILVTTGSSEAIIGTLLCLLDFDDEVVMLNPEYLLYKPIVQYLGAKVREVRVTVDNEFNPREEELKETISKRTKVMILVNPDNPTGAVLREEIIKLAIDLAKDYNFYIIYDEAYKHLYYEGYHTYAVKYDLEHVIALNTFSKDPALPGWRLGYIVAHDEFVKFFQRIKQYVNINAPTPAQYLALLYLRKYKRKYLEETLPIYRERRDAMYNALVKYLPEVKVIKPKAGLFIFPNFENYLKKLNMGDDEFAVRLLREENVAVVPGSAFGDGGKYHVRLCFAKENPKRIDEGIERIAKYLEKYL